MAARKRSALLVVAIVLPWVYVFFDLGQWLYLAYQPDDFRNLAILNGRTLQGSDSLSTSSSAGRSFEAHMQNSTSGKKLHNYGFMYAQYFDQLWDKDVAFMEIGLRQGDSMDLWKRFFQNAKVYGVDKGASDFQGFRSYVGKDPNQQIFIGDQGNVSFLHELSAIIRSEVGGLDFVIDDGGHTMQQQITSFTHLMPLIKPGGVYFIEDLETSYYGPDCTWFGCYGQCCGGGPPGHKGTTVALIKSLIDVLNEDFVKGPNPQAAWNIGHYSVNPADHLVGSFQCWRNMCAIRKKKENSYF